MVTQETNSIGQIVNVDWEKGNQFDDAGDGHCFMFEATGIDSNGRTWLAAWIEVDGEFADIVDVEENEETYEN